MKLYIFASFPAIYRSLFLPSVAASYITFVTTSVVDAFLIINGKTVVILVTMLFSFGFAKAQTIQSSNYSTTGYIKSDGTIQNSSYSTVGYIKQNGTIQNSNYSTIGYIKSDGTIQNSSYSTVGYVKSDGTVQNSSYSTIGYIKNDGTVQNSSYSTIGYAKGVDKKWAAVTFFFFKFN